LKRRRAERQLRRQQRGMRAARPVRRAVRVALALDLDRPLALAALQSRHVREGVRRDPSHLRRRAARPRASLYAEHVQLHYPDGAAHGSGCTHSSLLAAQLALGATPLEAARVARALTAEAVRDGLREVGAGAGPVDVLGLARIRAQAERKAGS
ncbi:MAG TPA: bifunctional hydroxymethylpyrimidine kinase/phosphomethylpyrimidine kinase, partial [Solirubrobacteraceae bacterium]|nr:bifunctional hydroxymethylpyrimidine kinase/phosphomethylpyrimidine kinase [Solirubrobacteraceae bacterium]